MFSGIDLNEGALEIYSNLSGSDAQAARKTLRAAKKDAKKDCKKLKGKERRECKRNVRKNFRQSKNNVIRDGETWVSTAVNKVGNIATPLTSLVSGLVPGGSIIQSGLTALTGQKMTRNERQDENIQQPVSKEDKIFNTASKVLDLFKGSKTQNTTKTPSQEQTTMKQKLQNTWLTIVDKVKTSRPVQIGIAVGAVLVALVIWKKSKKGGRKKVRKL